MDPLTMAGISFGLNAIGSGLGFMGQQNAAKQNNKAIKARNQYAQAQRAYGEQIKDFEYKNALKIYEMRKEQSKLEIQEYQNAYKNYFFDEQMALNDLIDNARIQALQSDIKLQQAQSQTLASASARGVTGRRAGRGGVLAQNAIMAGMEGVQRARQLAMAEERADMRIDRTAYKTDLMSRMSVNRIGPRPERAPAAPAAFMESMDRGPSTMGLFSGLASAGADAFGVYSSLKAPSAGNVPGNQSTPTAASMGYTTNPATGNLRNGFGLSIR